MRISMDLGGVFHPGASDEDNALALQALLECLVVINRAFLRRYPGTRKLYTAGVKYGRTQVWDSNGQPINDVPQWSGLHDYRYRPQWRGMRDDTSGTLTFDTSTMNADQLAGLINASASPGDIGAPALFTPAQQNYLTAVSNGASPTAAASSSSPKRCRRHPLSVSRLTTTFACWWHAEPTACAARCPKSGSSK